MLQSGGFKICRSCFVAWMTPRSESHQLSQRTYSRMQNFRNRTVTQLQKVEAKRPSFRRKSRDQSPKLIQPVRSSKYPISKKLEDKVTIILRIAALYKANHLPIDEAKEWSERIIFNISKIDSLLGRKGNNPSILFSIFHHEPSRRCEIKSLLSLLKVAKLSRERDGIALGLALNLAPHVKRFPNTFQSILRILMEKKSLRNDKIAQHFLRRGFKESRLTYSSPQLIQWLCNVVASTRSMNCHLPLVARIIRTWNSGPIPLSIIYSLIWMYIPQFSNPDFMVLEKRYGVQQAYRVLSYNTLISFTSHSIRRSNPQELDILLIQTFIQHLIESDRFLYAISIFDALQDIKLESKLSSDILLLLFERLVTTQNYEEAIHVYSALLRRRLLDNGKLKHKSHHTPERVHISFVLQHTSLFVELLRGLRKSNQSQEYITELLTAIPTNVITRNHNIAAEILQYAGYWNNRELVQIVLNAFHHPLYDESFDTTSHVSKLEFSAELWSAILYAHVQLGLVNSSRAILQSMQRHGLQPRSEDMSAIVCGVAKFDLESGHDLAIKLSESLAIDAYETILEYALEQDHSQITKWATNLIAYEPRTNIYPQVVDDEFFHPSSFSMPSELSTNSTIPTCTARAKSAIIKQTAQKEGIGPSILLLLATSKMAFGRDVYDGLYDIAFDNGQLQYAMWIANKMREKGWMPRDYRALKKQVQHNHLHKRQWKWL